MWPRCNVVVQPKCIKPDMETKHFRPAPARSEPPRFLFSITSSRRESGLMLLLFCSSNVI